MNAQRKMIGVNSRTSLIMNAKAVLSQTLVFRASLLAGLRLSVVVVVVCAYAQHHMEMRTQALVRFRNFLHFSLPFDLCRALPNSIDIFVFHLTSNSAHTLVSLEFLV